MPVTKITLSTAMRARDVSRPHEDHLTDAARREDAVARRVETPSPHLETSPPKPAPPAAQPKLPELAPAPAPARRRRRRRS
jgi:hypothetical protein